MKRMLILLGILTMFSGRIVSAQEEGAPLTVASYRKIFSPILSEVRTVAVSLPYDYGKSGKRYPVLYILDGEDTDLASFIGMTRFLSPHRIPEMIIVGVVNTNRDRDLFSTKVEGLGGTTEDGAIRFLGFLSKELIPYIDSQYRTTPHRTIYGQSAGAHFVIFALLTAPDVFQAYLASSPVIGYSDQALLDRAETFFNQRKSLHKSLCVYYGTTDYDSVIEKIPQLESIIRKNPPEGFIWKIKAVEGIHVPWESFHELVIMLYPDWSPVRRPAFTPSQGEFLKGETSSVQILGGPDPVHYTVNGEEPSDRSPVYKDPVPMDRTTVLKAKSIRAGIQESRTVEARFQAIDKLRPSRKIIGPRKGLKFKYSEEQVFDLPDRIAGVPKKSGVVPAIDLGIRDRNQVYLIQFDGYLKVPISGRYRFTLRSTSAKLFLAESLVIASGGLAPEETVWDVCLESGFHSLTIVTDKFLQPSHVLELYWEGPGITKQTIPAQAFYYE